MSHETDAKFRERAKQYVAAQYLKDRWRRYSFPVQELLRLVLTKYGLEAAILATDALDRHSSRTSTTVTTVSQPRVVASAHGASSSKKGMLLHERCVKASLF